MAGRPRRTLKEITSHIATTHATLEWIRKRSPKTHQERTDRNDAVGDAWAEVAATGKEFWGKLGDLSRRVAERAELPDPWGAAGFPFGCDGRYATIAEWCEITDVPYNVAINRLRKGAYFEDAVFKRPTAVEIEEASRIIGQCDPKVDAADEAEDSEVEVGDEDEEG